jgi:hypothetical protein
MNTVITRPEEEVMGLHSIPAVSILMPFEPKMSSKAEARHRLKLAVGRAEKELMANYTEDSALAIIKKLQNLFQLINFNTHKKSIAIFVSPSIDKIFYLDTYIDEKVVIGESFAIRDLIYSKKQSVDYLVFILSAQSSKIYLGNSSKFTLIKSNQAEATFTLKRDLSEKVGQFSDPHEEKEILLNRFLVLMDEDLSSILKTYPLPLFVMGAKRVLGHFNKVTKNKRHIIQYIHGNYEDAGEAEIRQVIRPSLDRWGEKRQTYLIQQIEHAADEKTLSFGFENVKNATSHENDRLLIVERGFVCPDHFSLSHPFYIKDSIDEVIESVLLNGGDVEFVDNNILEKFEHIALIRFY